MIARRLFLAAACAMLATAAHAESHPDDLTGTYKAEGRNPDGSPYKGTVKIEDDGAQLRFAWKTGTTSYTGIGTRAGRVVTINWGADAPVYYVVMESGELHGTWAGGRALELLVRE